VSSPLHQFEIKTLIHLPKLAGFDVSFTNSSLAMVVSVVMTLLLTSFAARKQALIPSRLQSAGELFYSFVHSLVTDTAGKNAAPCFPLVFSLFAFIMFGNLFGMFPFAFTFTSHIIVTFVLAMVVFLFVTALGFAKHGLHFFRLFAPHGVPWYVLLLLIPIEIFSYCMRPVTMSLRLFANMMAGHIVLKVIIAMTISAGVTFAIFPFALSLAIIAFEFFIACVQAYIFSLLTCVYIKDALELH
jgi:F-type H+-transporting ATPase subunit a